MNQGNNMFNLAANTDPASFDLEDLTGRGVVDLLGGVGTSLLIWPNNGTPAFSSSPITLPQQPLFGPITVADMDGDGQPDIVALGEILYGNGAYQFTAVPMKDSFAAPYVLGHFTGTSRLDIATSTFTYVNMGK
jgi:FG-GAP-like repeat